MEAYIRGLERLVASGGDPRKVASVASFFVSRVDTEADMRLEAIGSDAALALRGKLAVANARLAYQNWQEVFSGERWEFLASKGASKQWCLWASTSTKNPDYPDTLYVDSLIGPETVNTMPLETVEAFQDHGTVALDGRGGARRGGIAHPRARPRSASTSTTSRRRSRKRACRSSTTPSRSCSTASAPSAASWSRPDAHRTRRAGAHGRQHGRAPAAARARGRDLRAHRPGADRDLARGARLEARARRVSSG